MPARSTYAKKRPASSRRAPVKSAKRWTYAPKVDSDSMNMLVTSYFEASVTQPNEANQATGGVFGYSLKCDPCAMAMKMSGTANGNGTVLVNLFDAANANTDINGGQLPFARLSNLLAMYRQCRIDSVKINVSVDRDAGLQNALNMLQDKGEDTPCVSIGQAMSQAHKSKIHTESDQTTSYGWTACGQDLEYHTINDKVSDVNAHYLKVLQEVEPQAGGKCKHRIDVICSVTLRDSKSVTGN